MENVNKDFKKRGISLIILMVAALILCPVACNRSNVKELPTGQEYVNKNGDGSLTVESAHKIRLWDGHGLPNTFTIKNGRFYNEYGDNVGKIQKRGKYLYIHSSNQHVESAYGGKYEPYEGHFKGYQHF